MQCVNDWRKAQKIKRTTVCNGMIKWIYWLDCLRVMWELEISHLPCWMMSVDQGKCGQPHDDDIKWKHFLHYWLFVQGILRSPVNSPHKGQWRGAMMFSLICALNKQLSKQSWGWWFEMPSRSLWHHCNAIWIHAASNIPVRISHCSNVSSFCEFNISSLSFTE